MSSRSTIDTVWLHCGLHKTGTTTFQQFCFQNRQWLREQGILYPEFRAGERPIQNHSIPLYSLFTGDPLSYHINRRMGIRSREELEKLHSSYLSQLRNQLDAFEGEQLLLSGEDLSLLKRAETECVLEMLRSLTGHPDLSFTILLTIRHPVEQFSSMVLEELKHGLLLEEAVARQFTRLEEGVMPLIEQYRELVGEENIHLIRFEEAAESAEGITGTLLRRCGVALPAGLSDTAVVANRSMSAEAATLLEGLHRWQRRAEKEREESAEPFYPNKILYELPGTRFHLSESLLQQVWEASSAESEQICKRYSLPLYEPIHLTEKPVGESWPLTTYRHLIRYLHWQPVEIRALIAELLQKEGADPQKPFKKRLQIRLFALLLRSYTLLLRIAERPLSALVSFVRRIR